MSYITDDIDNIVLTVSKNTGIEVKDILSKSRKRNIKDARFMAIAYARLNRNYKYFDIATYFDRDHTTIINAVKIFLNLIEYDKIMFNVYLGVCRDLKGKWVSVKIKDNLETYNQIVNNVKQIENQL